MKHASMLILFFLSSSFTVTAQQNSTGLFPATQGGMVGSLLPAAVASATLVSEDASRSAFPAPADAPTPQVSVQSVFTAYSLQLYGGYTFIRVYAFPEREVNRNGLDISLSYYPHSGHFGAEGALTAAFGSIMNENSDFAFAGGGARFRWSAPRGIDVWAHGLIGGAHFGPRIAGFGQGALGYELGGGVDINAHRQRLAYRFEADMVGTRLYSVSQYSPKFSAGIVF